MSGSGAIVRMAILGTGVDVLDPTSAADQIERWIGTRTPVYVSVANVHTVMETRWNREFAEAQRNANMVTPDGVPLVWFGRLSGFSDIRRVYGPDLMLELCRRSVDSGARHFCYGSTPEVLDRLVARLRTLYPGLRIAGTHSPPFRPLTDEETAAVIDKINRSGADILWVGLGAPKQEQWMAEIRPRLQTPVMVGVGAAFDFIAGTKPQAPPIVRRLGLEWLFRLLSEPGRLWKRYLSTNPAFLWLAARELLRGRGRTVR